MTATEYRFLGKRRPLLDGLEKVSGRARYAGDVVLPRMLHARPLLSPYASARILSIDTEAARAMPGVRAVLTDADLPSHERPIVSRTSAVLARDRVVFAGQPVAMVVAEDEGTAQDAVQAIQVEYEPLPPALDANEAMAEGAPIVWPDGLKGDEELASLHAAVDTGEEDDSQAATNVHGHVHFERGDVEAGLAQAEVVVRRTFRTSAVHQAYLEPHAVVADFDPVRRDLTIYTSTQGQFVVQNEVARLMGLTPQRVRVVQMTVGGGFGAKYGIIDPLVAAASMKVGLPVRMVLSRTEDFLATTPAPGSEIELELGVTAEGKVCALKTRMVVDNGVFPMGQGGIMATLIGGHYVCPNVSIDCFEVLTNKVPAGAYRAPGAPQISFALETAIDEAARELHLDSLELRLANVAGPGDPMGNNRPWPSLGLRQCLERLKEHPAWKDRTAVPDEGVGIAIGCWPGGASPAAAVCRVSGDGTVQVTVGSADISGAHGSMVLVAAEVLQVPPDRIELIQGDTRSGLYAGPAGGSQTTYSVSAAVRAAAEDVRNQLIDLAAERLEVSGDDVELQDGSIQVKGAPTRSVTIAELANQAEHSAGAGGPVTGDGRAAVEVNAPGAVAHLVRVRVDRETGSVTPLQYVAVQDVGFAMNPLLVEGQVHGGVSQGVGWGIFEGLQHDGEGQLVTASFIDYAIPSVDSMPDVDAILVENAAEHGPYGARIVGEPPVVPGAAVFANAIADAVGVRVTELPLTPEVVRAALGD